MENTGVIPRVSICCSVLNQSEWLREMIASVVAQTCKDWELIVVDDGSTEDVKAVVDSFNENRIQYHRFPENKGIPHGANYALKLIRGEFFGLLAADETLDPNKLEDQLAFMDANAGVDGIWGIPGYGPFGRRPEWEQNSLGAHNRSKEAWLRTLLNLEGVPIGGASFLMRRKVLDSIGYLDENLTIFSDHEFYCRFFEKHVGRILPYRWAVDKPYEAGKGSVREKNGPLVQKELAYVREKHQIILPPVIGKCTIGIPLYNLAGTVIESIKSAQAQTYKDLEIIILNDGSTDNSLEVVQKYFDENPDPRVRLMGFDENRGIQEAMNQMAFRAKGEFFTSLAADDTIEPDTIEKCLAEFKKNPWLEMVGTQTDFMDALGHDLTGTTFKHPFMDIPKAMNRPHQEWLNLLKMGNVYFGVSMYRTKVISEVGGWDKELGVIADYEMYLKLLMRENIHVIEEPLTHTRISGKNLSLLMPEQASNLPRLYYQAKLPYYKPVPKVVIATPFYELKGFSPYIWSLAQTFKLLSALGIQWEFMELSGDSYVHKARNMICEKFLADLEATDLFFIDSDMSWNPEALVHMVMFPEPIVGGSYPIKNRWDGWTSRPQMSEENGKQFYTGRALSDGSALMRADVLAGGFLRIKRAVLLKYRDFYPDLWFQAPAADQEPGKDIKLQRFTEFFSSQTHDHVFYGEDHMFSKRMRDMGMPMFIYPNVHITHWGNKGYAGNYHEFLKKQVDNPQQPEVAEELPPGLETRIPNERTLQ